MIAAADEIHAMSLHLQSSEVLPKPVRWPGVQALLERLLTPRLSRLRSARRQAALRRLRKSLKEPEQTTVPESAAAPAHSDSKLLAECVGRPYLIGAGTFLVAHYLLMARDQQASCLVD
jgi:hypothetical protein